MLNMGENVFEAQEKHSIFLITRHIITPYFCILFLLLFITIISTILQSQPANHNLANAAEADTAISVNVADACLITNTIEVNKQHTATVQINSYTPDIGETLISVNCNDVSGYSVYVVGYTNDTEGANTLTGSNTGLTIPTGTSVDATTSNWAMKLISVSGIDAPTILSDNNGSFASYHIIPATATKVATLTSNTESSSSFKTTYAVAIGTSQPADTYSGQVKYTLVHPNNADADGTVSLGECTSLATCMQTFTADMCEAQASDAPVTLTDARDGNTYTVRYIEGACWMTQNLRITGIVNAQNSNFSTYSNVNVCEDDLTIGNSYDMPRCHDSGNTTNGVWYNYVAASAKTIIGSSNMAEAIEDICPANWHLPSYDADNTPGSINSLSSTSATSVLKFAPVDGGNYYYGKIWNISRGYWWSTTASSDSYRYILDYRSSGLSAVGNIGDDGIYIRCVRQ